MPTTRPPSQNKHVEWNEFNDFRREIHSELNMIRDDVTRSLKEFAYQINNASRPNYSLIISLISVGIVLSGMAGALIQGSIGAEEAARIAAVQSQTMMRQETVKRLDDNSVMAARILDEFKNATRDRFEGLDTILQREMRLLDDVLNRQMSLHVDRLEDLIEVNTKAIEKLEGRTP